MKNDGSTLDSILMKAASFTEQIEKVQSLSKQLKEEKSALSQKEDSLEEDLFTLVNSLHSFQQKTISALSDLHAKVQAKAEQTAGDETKAVILEDEIQKEVQREVKEEVQKEVPKEVQKEEPVEVPKEIPEEAPQEEVTEDVVFEVKKETPPEPVKEVKKKKEEKKEKKPVKAKAKGDEEVFLFDL